MGNKTVGFVLKTQEYCNLAPHFLDAAELNTGIKAFEQIRAIHQPLLQITGFPVEFVAFSGKRSLFGLAEVL